MTDESLEKAQTQYRDNLPEIVRQLELCGYQSEGGPLQNNVAFEELKRMSEKLAPAPAPAPVWPPRRVFVPSKGGIIEIHGLKYSIQFVDRKTGEMRIRLIRPAPPIAKKTER